ncbi:hypothetical protein FB451DRAFT_1164546 [Mycena latifolia]|nr:hypothetical protein FB451DRAFT_1164546 [Mycena latifolia]
MPNQPTITEIRLKNIIASLTPAISLLNELNDGFRAPFVQAISNTTLSLIAAVQRVKRNKDECVQLMENIHQLLFAIINLHIKSETGGSLPPTILDQIGKFTEYLNAPFFFLAKTLHKIHMFVEVQEGNKIKRIFRQNEISTLLKDCQEGVQQALDTFEVEAAIFSGIAGMQKTAETMHKELLEMISSLSDGTTSDRSSSMYQYPNGSQHSSKSFSMLPSKPKIFHGRDSELQDIVKMLNGEPPRIAILGAGGMGKTSLARAALHHPDITTKYDHRFFVPCDSANDSIEVAAILGTYLELKPGKDLKKSILQYFSKQHSSLLILDNLETPWEPKESRHDVEGFLSLLADIKHLALIITMRGAERPAKVRWTRPFLPPLKPLANDAAWQTFVDIAEESHKSEDIKHLLRLTDNMPLAVDLIAHLVTIEGCSEVLSRWETEKTSLLSNGDDRRSSLDASIALSISSSRMYSTPGAKDLLSLLSILPDGLSNAELLQSKLQIKDILSCKTTLLGTSLAYVDDSKRLKSLVPIREHVLRFHPPSASLIEPLQKHFHLLLDVYRRYGGVVQIAGKIDQITSNSGNLQQILQRGLHPDSRHLTDAIKCTIALNSFRRFARHGWLSLMDLIPDLLPQLCNHRLEVQFIIETFNSVYLHPVSDLEPLVNQAVFHFQHFNDPALEAAAMQFLEKGLTLARSSTHISIQSQIIGTFAEIKWTTGDYLSSWIDACEAQRLAQMSANRFEETQALEKKAKCCLHLGNYKQSIILLNRGRELLKLCGLNGGVLDFYLMNNEAEVHLLKSEYAQAKNIHTRALQDNSAEQNPNDYAWILINIAELGVILGACKDNVHQNLEKANTIFKTIGQSSQIIYSAPILGDLYLRERNTEAARAVFLECLHSSWGRQGSIVSRCLERLADINRWKVTDFSWTSRWTVVYLAHAKSTHMKLPLHKALQFIGDIFLYNGDEQTAHSLFMVALEGFTLMDVHHSRANCMLRLGDIAKQRGKLVEAVELWRNARPLFEQSLQTRDVAEINTRLSAADRAHQKILDHLNGVNKSSKSLDPPLSEHFRTEEVEEQIQQADNASPVTI